MTPAYHSHVEVSWAQVDDRRSLQGNRLDTIFDFIEQAILYLVFHEQRSFDDEIRRTVLAYGMCRCHYRRLGILGTP